VVGAVVVGAVVVGAVVAGGRVVGSSTVGRVAELVAGTLVIPVDGKPSVRSDVAVVPPMVASVCEFVVLPHATKPNAHAPAIAATTRLEDIRRRLLPGAASRRRPTRRVAATVAAMSSETKRVDAVVVGAGTAGANAAYQLARRGHRVVLLERRAAHRAGAQWHNGVLDWQFARAGLAPPEGPERADAGRVTHLFGPDGAHGVTVHDSPVVRADMHLLGVRLRALATDTGVELVDHVASLDVDVRRDRIIAVEVTTDRTDGAPRNAIRFEAPLFVDASGRRGVLRRHVPALARWCPEVRGSELCTASDHHIRIDNPDGAKRFLERHGAKPGEAVTVVGLEGGFSTRAITVSQDLEQASVLVGCLADGRHSSGPRMMAATRVAEPWLGASISGGSGVIPLRRPFARFTAPGVALVGDAACQVFPAHGSGIGMGLIAGRMLADAVGEHADPGDEQVLWNYQASFQHEHGGVLAAFDAFRRMSTALGGEGVRRMIRAGLLTEDMTRGGLEQRWQTPPLSRLPTMARKLAAVPGVAMAMLPSLASGQRLWRMGPRHPHLVDVLALERWDAAMKGMLGPLPS